MTTTDWIGFIGVSILLVAFFLNLTNKIKQDGIVYLAMNFIGAGLACLASVLLKYVPFIILEASWTLVSLFGLIKYFTKKMI
jgi:nicotinamide riboside transporter PnuC